MMQAKMDDGAVVTAYGQAGERFLRQLIAINLEMREKKERWIEALQRAGVVAAHPDDGWVDRAKNSMQMVYPHFSGLIEVGSRIALGQPDKYRIVDVTAIRKTMFGFTVYEFKHKP